MLERSIDSREKFASPEGRYAALALALAKDYISVAEVDLRTGYAVVLKAAEDRELEGREMLWPSLLAQYTERRAYPEDQEKLRALSADCLEEILKRGSGGRTFEVRCLTSDVTYMWVEIDVLIISITEKRLLITTRSIDEQRMMKTIIEQFVYQSYDYFVVLNATKNSYTMFSGDKYGTPLPPVSGDDYEAEVARYNSIYLIPADCERVTANMQIAHVQKMLEQEESYSFCCNGLTEEGAQRRTRIQFRYYDKAAGLILLTRADITEMFLEEQAKNERLTAALYNAQHDSLTGLLNQKGIEQLAVDSLKRLEGEQAAFLFIDVDNFKMVNDTLGHQEGDRLLKFLAGSIQKTAGQAGIAGRIGGDEFLLYLPGYSSKEQLMEYAMKICHAFDSFTWGTGMEVPVSCSVGISTYPKDGADYSCLLRKADQALYTSKRYGKNRCYFYSEEVAELNKKI